VEDGRFGVVLLYNDVFTAMDEMQKDQIAKLLTEQSQFEIGPRASSHSLRMRMKYFLCSRTVHVGVSYGLFIVYKTVFSVGMSAKQGDD
jgi:hypothetical protein